MSAQPAPEIATLPLTPQLGAVQLLLLRAETVSIDTYLPQLRMLYRFALHDNPEDGFLIPGFAERHPVGPDGKTPSIDAGLIRRTIRRELNLSDQTPLTRRHSQAWLAERHRELRTGVRKHLLSAEERAALLPDWAVEALAAFMDIGPAATRRRVESFGATFAEGKDGFVSTKSAGEASRAYPTPSSVRGVGEAAAGLFAKGSSKLKARNEADIPRWLAPWPGDWEQLAINPHPLAMQRSRPHVGVKNMSAALGKTDKLCATPFLARYNKTDIEIARDPAAFISSFPTPALARAWLQNTNVALLIRDRALSLVALIVGERQPELTSVLRGSLYLPPFEHPGLRARWGIHRPVGAILFPRSQRVANDLGAHYAPLPLEVCDRLQVLLFLYEVLLGEPLDDTAPLFLQKLFSSDAPVGLGARAIGTAAASILHRFGDFPKESDTRAYNIIRRYTDNVILDNFDEYRQATTGIPAPIDARTVKEITLGHYTVTVDPHTYSGLSDAEGRFVVSSYGADLVVQTIYGELGIPRGPDRNRVLSEVASRRGLEQARARVKAEYADTFRPAAVGGRGAGLRDVAEGAALVSIDRRQALQDHRDALAAQRDALTDGIEIRGQLIEELVDDPDLWIPLDEGEVPLSKRELKRLSRELGRVRQSPYPPVRDFYTMLELAMLLKVDVSSIRAWINHPCPEQMSRNCPWIGTAPVVRPNERTVLIAAAALRTDRITNPAVWDALRKRLTVWPSERGWDRCTGAKSRAVRLIAAHPVVLASDQANDLLTEAPDDCVRIFRLRGE